MIQCQTISTWQEFSTFPQHFSTPCGKLCRRTPEKLAQGTVVSYYTWKCSRFLRYCKYIWYIVTYHFIHWLFQESLLILGGCLLSELICGRESVDYFLEKSYPWLYTLILTNLSGLVKSNDTNSCDIWYNLMWFTFLYIGLHYLEIWLNIRVFDSNSLLCSFQLQHLLSHSQSTLTAETVSYTHLTLPTKRIV